MRARRSPTRSWPPAWWATAARTTTRRLREDPDDQGQRPAPRVDAAPAVVRRQGPRVGRRRRERLLPRTGVAGAVGPPGPGHLHRRRPGDLLHPGVVAGAHDRGADPRL